MPYGAQLGLLKPLLGKFPPAVSHVFAAENTHLKHLLRGKLGLKIRVKPPARGSQADIPISALHLIVYHYNARR